MAVDKWLSEWGVLIGIGGAMIYMTFIMWDLAKRSNAGRFGTVIIFSALGMGVVGFLVKMLVKVIMESSGV